MAWTKEKWQEWRRNYYQKNKATILAMKNAEYKADPEKFCRRQKERRRVNPEKFREIDRLGREKYREQRRKSHRLWYYRDPARNTANTRKWLKEHPEKNREKSNHRRALLMQAPVGDRKLITAFIKRVRSKRFVRCYYCDEAVPGKEAEIDHVKALKGKEPGPHEVGNLCASCPKCNGSKLNHPLTKWQPPTPQRVLAL